MIIKIKEKTIPPKILNTIFNVKSFILHNSSKYFYYIIFSSLLANATEPILVQVTTIVSNEIQKVQANNFSFYSIPYGILGVSNILNENQDNQNCQQSLQELYLQNPKLKYFSQYLLQRNQLYHVEIKNQKTLLYAKGDKTLSLLLLENGLAIVENNFRDEEFKFSFMRAQKQAKKSKKGIWKKKIIQNCSLR